MFKKSCFSSIETLAVGIARRIAQYCAVKYSRRLTNCERTPVYVYYPASPISQARYCYFLLFRFTRRDYTLYNVFFQSMDINIEALFYLT